MFFFTGYEFYRQKLDTGTLQSWVPTQAMRDGDFSNTASFANLGNSYVSTMPTNLVNGRVPANLDRPERPAADESLPAAQRDPARNRRYNYVQNIPIDQNMHQWLTRVDINVSNNTRLFARYNFQAEEQNFPVGLWWRNAAQVPYPTEGHRLRTGRTRERLSLTKSSAATLTTESTFATTLSIFRISCVDPEPRVPVRARLHEPGYLRSPVWIRCPP